MAWASTLPAVVAKLSDVLTPALDPTRLLVWSHVEASALMEAVTIAFQDENTPAVADGQFTSEGLVSNPDRESYAIHCRIAVRDGSNDLGAATTRAFALLGIVGAAHAADRSLGGLVLTSSSVGVWSLAATQDTQGALAELDFDIDIDAYTTL